MASIVSAIAETASSGVPLEFCRVGETYDDVEFETHNENGTLSPYIYPDGTISVLC